MIQCLGILILVVVESATRQIWQANPTKGKSENNLTPYRKVGHFFCFFPLPRIGIGVLNSITQSKRFTMFSRKQYMAQECTHQDYYAQFAPIFKVYVASKFTKEYIREKYAEDKHLNNLQKGWMGEFDRVTELMSGEIAYFNRKLNNESCYSLSDGTCAIKAQMKIYAGVV